MRILLLCIPFMLLGCAAKQETLEELLTVDPEPLASEEHDARIMEKCNNDPICFQDWKQW